MRARPEPISPTRSRRVAAIVTLPRGCACSQVPHEPGLLREYRSRGLRQCELADTTTFHRSAARRAPAIWLWPCRCSLLTLDQPPRWTSSSASRRRCASSSHDSPDRKAYSEYEKSQGQQGGGQGQQGQQYGQQQQYGGNDERPGNQSYGQQQSYNDDGRQSYGQGQGGGRQSYNDGGQQAYGGQGGNDFAVQGGAQWNQSASQNSYGRPGFDGNAAAQHAAQESGEDGGMFAQAMQHAQQTHSNNDTDVDEDHVQRAHDQAYNQGQTGNMSAQSMGQAAALNALKKVRAVRVSARLTWLVHGRICVWPVVLSRWCAFAARHR